MIDKVPQSKEKNEAVVNEAAVCGELAILPCHYLVCADKSGLKASGQTPMARAPLLGFLLHSSIIGISL